MASFMYSSCRMLASARRLTAGDDVKTPEHALRHSFCIRFNLYSSYFGFIFVSPSVSLILLKLCEGVLSVLVSDPLDRQDV